MDTTTLSSVTFCCENEKKNFFKSFLYVTTSIYFSSISESKFD